MRMTAKIFYSILFLLLTANFSETSAQTSLRPKFGLDKPLQRTPLKGPRDSNEEVPGELGDEWPEDQEDEQVLSYEGDFESGRANIKDPKAVGAAGEADLDPSALLKRAEKRSKAKNQTSIDGRRSRLDQDPRFQDESEETQLWSKDLEDAKSRSRKKASSVEQLFMGKLGYGVSRKLQQFGYSVFDAKPESFVPTNDVPISPDYIVGPGDKLVVNIWGSANLTYRVVVRRDGTIFLPKIGTMKAWGLSFQELTGQIQKRVEKFFSGVKVSIGMDAIRMIDVFVVGEVEKPGSYSIPSTSTPLNALFYAGGPNKSGSLRNIQVIRGNKKIADVDLYDFLIHGKNSAQQLQSQDVILVPVIGSVVALAGSVKRPAIYEIKESPSLAEMIEMGGGLSFTGTVGRLSLERVEGNKTRVTRDFQLPENFMSLSLEDKKKTDLKASVQDGDLVQIFSVLPTFQQTVYLRGHVKRPGAYEFKKGMKLKDLVGSYDQLERDPYTDFIQVIRFTPPKDEAQSIFVSLSQLMQGSASANILLQEKDEVVVFSKEELNLQEKVRIEGQVNKPGEYFFFKGMRLRDLIFMAGNLKQSAYLANAEIARYSIETSELKFRRIQVDLNQVLKGDEKDNLLLEPKDRIQILGINWELENFISLDGEVRFPGRYSFSKNERLSSVIERAGGYNENAFLPGSIFTRESVRLIQEKSLKEQIQKLEQDVLTEGVKGQVQTGEAAQAYQEAIASRNALLKTLKESEVSGRMVIKINELEKFRGSQYDVQLEPGDKLFVPPEPSVVTIMGEVFSPTSVVFIDGKDIQYYLSQAGGTTMNADTDSIFVIRADGSVISKRQERGFLVRNFSRSKIQRGDAILVPRDISRFSWLSTTKDLTEILFKIASTTGITIQAFK